MRKSTIKFNILLSAWLLSVILIGMASSVFAAQTFESNLDRGSYTYTVSTYDKDAWKKAVGGTTPDDWFQGDADKVDSQSRVTIRSAVETTYKTAELWYILFSEDMSKEASQLYLTEEKSINDEYSTKYKGTEVLYAKWDFTSDSFEEDAETPDAYILIMGENTDYSDILDNYNEWANTVNVLLQMDPKTAGISYQNYTNEEFFWKLVLNDLLVVGAPTDKYLKNIIDTLDITDAKAKDNKLIIENSDYKIEFSYDSNGMQNSISIMDDDSDMIYEISEDTSNEIWLVVIPIVIIISIVGLIYLAIRNRKSRN